MFQNNLKKSLILFWILIKPIELSVLGTMDFPMDVQMKNYLGEKPESGKTPSTPMVRMFLSLDFIKKKH